MRLNLDHPARTTRDYEGPAVAPRVQAALDAAMNNVEEVSGGRVESLCSFLFCFYHVYFLIKNKKRTLTTSIGI